MPDHDRIGLQRRSAGLTDETPICEPLRRRFHASTSHDQPGGRPHDKTDLKRLHYRLVKHPTTVDYLPTVTRDAHPSLLHCWWILPVYFTVYCGLDCRHYVLHSVHLNVVPLFTAFTVGCYSADYLCSMKTLLPLDCYTHTFDYYLHLRYLLRYTHTPLHTRTAFTYPSLIQRTHVRPAATGCLTVLRVYTPPGVVAVPLTVVQLCRCDKAFIRLPVANTTPYAALVPRSRCV